MLDICLLGTGGMMPLPGRWLTSLMTRYNGSNLLIDCGEGTQIAIKEKGWTVKPLDVICFTHYHADHISGLPGLLLAMGNAERTEPVTMVGPRGLERVVNGLRVIAAELPFEIKFIEITEAERVLELAGYRITAFRVSHNMICYGYSLEILRQGKFDVERAKAQNIPLKFWNPLQKGQTMEENGVVYTPDMVLGADRKGLKVTYCTDSRPTASIAAHAADIAKKIPHARDLDNAMADARRSFDWEKQWECSIDPETARAIRADRAPEHEDSCSMCGKFCAVRSMNKALSGEYIDIL